MNSSHKLSMVAVGVFLLALLPLVTEIPFLAGLIWMIAFAGISCGILIGAAIWSRLAPIEAAKQWRQERAEYLELLKHATRADAAITETVKMLQAGLQQTRAERDHWMTEACSRMPSARRDDPKRLEFAFRGLISRG